MQKHISISNLLWTALALTISGFSSQAAVSLRFDAAAYSVAESAGELIVLVSRRGEVGEQVSTDFATVDTTAKAGEDYIAPVGPFVFEQGVTNKFLRIAIINDGLSEPTESFRLEFFNTSAGVTTGPAATVSIVDNEGIKAEFGTYRVQENSGSVAVAVSRSAEEKGPASINYATLAGTATAGVDYLETNGLIHFAAGERQKFVSLTILNDGIAEPTESFSLQLSNPVGGTLRGVSTIRINIDDDDNGIEFSPNQFWAHEEQGYVDLRVVRGDDGVLGAATVGYAVSNGTAQGGVDFVLDDGIISFALGEREKSIRVRVANDLIEEPDEKFQVRLLNPSGGTLGRLTNQTASVTICDSTGMEPRRFGQAHQTADGKIQIEFVGTAHKRFQSFYSIYQLEFSPDLRNWQPARLLGYRNDSTNPIVFAHSPPAGVTSRFYRLLAAPFVTPSVPPTGPLPVGITRRLVTNPYKFNRYEVSTNNSFFIMIWYPANPRIGEAPAPYEEPILGSDLGWQTPDWMDKAPRFSSYSFMDAPVRSVHGGYPILIHSHGLGSARYENMERAEHLASHGYIVVTVNHRDSGVEVFPNGTLFFRAQAPAATAEGFADRVADMILTTDALAALNGNDPLLAGAMDLDRIAASGFSWGTHTAAEFCRVDPRGKVVVSLDWGVGSDSTAPDILRLGVQKPLIMLNASDNSSQVLFTRATEHAYWVQIGNTSHLNFHGYDWFTFSNSPSAREATRTINAYVRSFLDKYLKDQDDHLLDGRVPDYPRVTRFLRK